MKLIKTTENGLLKFSTLDVVAGNALAEMLEIEHSKMLRTIKRVMKCEDNRKKDTASTGVIFSAFFKEWTYKDSMNRERKTFIMNEDALYLVIANSQSAKAHELKVWFKSEFNKMKQEWVMRTTSKELASPFGQQVKRLQQKLFDEKSDAAPKYFATIHRQINKAATGHATNRGGVDHDTFTSTEDYYVAYLRCEVAYLIAYMFNIGYSGKKIKNILNEYIKVIIPHRLKMQLTVGAARLNNEVGGKL